MATYCERCGGTLIFDPKIKKISCKLCLHTFDISEIKMIDVPQNKRVPIENDFSTKYKKPEYMTSEEADTEIETTKASYRQKAGID